MDTIDINFLNEHINEFIELYFSFDNDRLRRESQYRKRWARTAAGETTDIISPGTVLPIQFILKEKYQRTRERDWSKNRIVKELSSQLDKAEKCYQREEQWRFILMEHKRLIIDLTNKSNYDQFVDEQINIKLDNPRFFGL